MNEALSEAIQNALIEMAPSVIDAVRGGRDIKTLALGEFISYDALAKVQKANRGISDYIEKG
jgi:hypothetical protein